jgi:hypothetical protein
MNIVSTMVGLSIAGASAPMLMDMSLAPVVAQKRALNFGQAEAAAVSYAAANEFTEDDLLEPPSGCSNQALDAEGLSWEITCRAGVDTQFEQVVSRSFRVMPLRSESLDGGTGANGTGSNREFARAAIPFKDFYHSHCYGDDPWGLDWFDRHPNLNQPCRPRATYTKQAYLDSDPDAWLFDINNWNGWGSHPDY